MMRRFFICIICVYFFFLTRICPACTTFVLKTDKDLIFGKNYDWMIDFGFVTVNKRGVFKSALVNPPDKPSQWTSKYGSLTFNQFGKEFPNGGINEKGLVIELMWLDDTKYPPSDNRPVAGGTLQWIQYQLDNCSSVDEVIQSDKEVRIAQNTVPIHYLIADYSGKTASIEFIEGKLVTHTNDKVMALTNDTYEKSQEYFMQHSSPDENDKSSLNRFALTCKRVIDYNPSNGVKPVDYGFEVLKTASQGDYTQWSIIYDIKNLTIYFKSNKNKEARNILLSSLDFICSTPVKIIDINTTATGNINDKMHQYSYGDNRNLIDSSYSNVGFLMSVSKTERDFIASYPDKMICKKMGIGDMFANFNLDQNSILIISGLLLLLFFLMSRRKKSFRSYNYPKDTVHNVRSK